jgi:hypothetical protein
MDIVASRAAPHWSRVFAVVALAALGACSDDDPVAPKTPLTARAAVQSLGPIDVTVTNTSGGTEAGSLRWAAKQLESVGGTMRFDSTLGGKTITLDAGLVFKFPTDIFGPPGGITISGKDQFRLIDAGELIGLVNLTLTKGNAPIGSAVQARQIDMYHTTITGNRGPDGAVFVLEGGVIANSTISGNTTSRAAVMYSDYTKLWFGNSTIAFNAAGGIGPYGFQGGTTGPITLENSIISNNGGPNCATYHGLAYVGKNIVNDWSCADNFITPSEPQLMPLANNGGPNKTHAIPHTSPAYNAGVDCNYAYEDQRHVVRDATCDVGAFEFNDLTKVTITIDPTTQLNTTSSTGYAFLTGTMKCTREETIPLRLELRQQQKVGKEVVTVHTTALAQVDCSPTVTTWGRKMFLTTGTWQAGAAQATATTVYTPDWVAPASVSSGVRLSVVRK